MTHSFRQAIEETLPWLSSFGADPTGGLTRLLYSPEWLQAHPRYGYLIVAGILLLWLVGIVCGWRWTYSRPGSWEGNFWLGTLGERSYRFWLGLIVAAAAGCALLLFFVTG